MNAQMAAEQLRVELINERLRLGLTQQQLGEDIGRNSYNTISQWERAVADPGLRNFLEWAAALGFTVTLTRAERLERAS